MRTGPTGVTDRTRPRAGRGPDTRERAPVSNDRTAWWRDQAAAFGPGIMEHRLRRCEDWQDLLASGRDELARALVLTACEPGRTGPRWRSAAGWAG